MKTKVFFMLLFVLCGLGVKTTKAQISTDTSYRLPGKNYIDNWFFCATYVDNVQGSFVSNISGLTVTPDSFYLAANSNYYPQKVSFTAPDSAGSYYYSLSNNLPFSETTHIIVTDTPPGINTYNFTLQQGQEADTTITLINSYYLLYQSTCGGIAPFNYTNTYHLSVFPATTMVQVDSSQYTLSYYDSAHYNLKVLGSVPGYYTYYIQTLCDSGWPLYNRVNVTVTDTLTGINRIGESSGIRISPNPNATGHLSVSGLTQGQTIEIYNCEGQRIDARIVNNATINFDIAAYASGMYLVRVQNQDGSMAVQKKIVKTQ